MTNRLGDERLSWHCGYNRFETMNKNGLFSSTQRNITVERIEFDDLLLLDHHYYRRRRRHRHHLE